MIRLATVDGRNPVMVDLILPRHRDSPNRQCWNISGSVSANFRLNSFENMFKSIEKNNSHQTTMPQATRGALIVIEGLDRAGKSTQCERLCQRLKQKGHSVKLLRFPGKQTPYQVSFRPHWLNSANSRCCTTRTRRPLHPDRCLHQCLPPQRNPA